jgi:Zn-dependent peptidase ImmA (M78 family)
VALLESYRYEKLKNIGADIIEDAKITAYPFDVFAVARNLDIKVVSYQSLSADQTEACFQVSEDGFNLVIHENGKTQCVIHYNAELCEGRVKFTIMHEIIHISMGHEFGTEDEESEADFLAAFILCPPCIVFEKEIEDYIDLASEFGVSYEMAHYRINAYHSWLKYGRSAHTDYDLRILSMYKKNYAVNENA